MLKKEKNTVKLKEGIDGLMLIVKKLRQLIDQKDERIKELSRKQATSSPQLESRKEYMIYYYFCLRCDRFRKTTHKCSKKKRKK